MIGMDVVEVSPPYDHSEVTSNAAAMIAIEMLCLKAWARGARPWAVCLEFDCGRTFPAIEAGRAAPSGTGV